MDKTLEELLEERPVDREVVETIKQTFYERWRAERLADPEFKALYDQHRARIDLINELWSAAQGAQGMLDHGLLVKAEYVKPLIAAARVLLDALNSEDAEAEVVPELVELFSRPSQIPSA